MAAAFYFHGKYGRNFGPLSFIIFIVLITYKIFEKYDPIIKIILIVLISLIFFFLGLWIGLKKIFDYEEERRIARPRDSGSSNPSKPGSSSNLPIINSNNNQNNSSGVRNNKRVPKRIPEDGNSPLLNENAIEPNPDPNSNKASSTPDGVIVRRPAIKRGSGTISSGLANNFNENDENKSNPNPNNLDANIAIPRRTAARKDIGKGPDPKNNINSNSISNSVNQKTVRIISDGDFKKNEKKDDIKIDIKKDQNTPLPKGDSLPKADTSQQPMKPAYRRPVTKRSDSVNNK